MTSAVLRNDTFPAEDRPVLSVMRLCALDCRAAGRGAVAACRAIDPDAGVMEVGMVLACALPGMMERRPVFWRPGTVGLTFDESWLLALCDALARTDTDSVRFLLDRRVRPQARPVLRTMLTTLMSRLEAAELLRDPGPSFAQPIPAGGHFDRKGDFHGRNRIRPVDGCRRRHREGS